MGRKERVTVAEEIRARIAICDRDLRTAWFHSIASLGGAKRTAAQKEVDRLTERRAVLVECLQLLERE